MLSVASPAAARTIAVVTYSIVARDPQTGELGAAVQSHWFAVGAVVPWARPGVGAVVTQAFADITYGPRALDLLASGVVPADVLRQLTAADSAAASRQVAIVDVRGRAAAHTGAETIAFAGQAVAQELQVSCQANMMANATVWGAMLAAYRTSSGPLAERLLAALDAAEDAGGDIRGRQSAAILTVPGTGEPWESTVSLRVDDDPEPLVQIRRLLRLHRAYELANRGDELLAERHPTQAAAAYSRALELAPESEELLFWVGLGDVQAGEIEQGLERIRRAIAAQPGFSDLLDRMPAELAQTASIVRERLAAPSRAAQTERA